MGTNYALLLADIFLYSCKAEFIQKRVKTFTVAYNLTIGYAIHRRRSINLKLLYPY